MIRLYAALLRVLLPSGFRGRYGAEMEVFFAEGWREMSGWARVRFGARALADLAGTALWARTGGHEPGEGEATTRGWVEDVGRDLQHGFRALRRRPEFAATALLTIALGIGAATAVFTVVDAVILRPLPFEDPDELVSMWTTFDNTGDSPFGVSLAVQYDYRQASQTFETLGGFSAGEVTLTRAGDARRVPTANLWQDVFGVTGIGVTKGRLPAEEELESGASPVALVTGAFWRETLGGDPDVVGSVLELDGRQVEILGVLDDDAWLPGVEDARIWLPVQRSRSQITDRSGHSMFVLGRLVSGATVADARRDRDRIQRAWDQEWAGRHSPGHPGHDLRMAPAHEWYFGDLRPLGRLLLGAAGLLLALACANVASLLLARGVSRGREFAVRRALGASRGRLIRALLAENGLLAVVGGALGLTLAVLGTERLLALAPSGLPRIAAVGLDGRVALFAALVSIGSGLVFGAVPALWAARRPSGARGGAGPDRALSRSLHGLMAGQIAFAVLLVSGAGLLTRSVSRMLSTDPGLEAHGRLTATLSIPAVRYPEVEDATAFWDEALRVAGDIPGVESVALARTLPFRDELRTEGMVLQQQTGRYSESMPVADQIVSPDYFSVAGIPVVEGRGLRSTDRRATAHVAVVNETAARRYFPGVGAVGQVVQPLWVTADHGPLEIVGVVGDVLHGGVREEPFPELYLPFAQAASNERNWVRRATLILRSREGAGETVASLRRAVGRLDPEVPVEDVATWDDVIGRSVATEQFVATVVGSFSVLALILAALGTYGVIAFSTARRMREVGVRLALGARRRRIVRDILLRVVSVAALGAAVGVGGAMVGAPLLRAFVFGVPVRDPVALLTAPLLMALVAVAAAWVPALRAGRIDPVEALRAEE